MRRLQGLLEAVLLAVVYYFVWRVSYTIGREQYGTGIFPPFLGRGKIVLMIVYIILVSVLFYLCDGFRFGQLKMIDVMVSQWIAIIIVNVVTYLQLSLIANAMVPFLPILILTGLDLILCAALCFLFTWMYHMFYVPRNMVMIYGSKSAVDLKFKMETRQDKYRITELVPVEMGLDVIRAEIAKHDAVIINDVPAQIRNDILKYCYQYNIRTYVAPKISDIIVRGASDVNLFDTPLVLVKGRGLSIQQRAIKRLFDIVLSLLAVIVLSPVMLAVALAIKIDDGGPVFFRQERVTKDGRLFTIIKFRSMIVGAEKEGEAIMAVDDDPRITRVGRFIRAVRLDELPQLFNILQGSMSICGPRPERVEHVLRYTEAIPEFSYRHKVKAGLTGYAQVYGKYNTSPYDKIRLDLFYIENYSLLLDFKIILLTLRVLFKKESTEGGDKIEELKALREEAIALGELQAAAFEEEEKPQ